MNLIDLRRTGDSSFELDITPQICVGDISRMFMFGGVGLGASISALEQVTGRPIVWATAQYESFVRPGEKLRLSVDERVRGFQVSQARVSAMTEDREVLSVAAALGMRNMEHSGQWTIAPAAPPPSECPPRQLWQSRHLDDVHARIEFRIAKGAMGNPDKQPAPSTGGHAILWARPDQGTLGPDARIDSSFVAVVADYVPSGIGPALGTKFGGNSLDNSIRFHRMVPTNWLLCDLMIHGVANGFAHGRMHIFAETGELIATASQSLIVR